MSVEYEAANKFTTMALQGIEAGGKMGKEAAAHLLKMLYHAISSDKKGENKARDKFTKLLSEGKTMRVYTIPEKGVTDFAKGAKKMGVEYFVIKDREKNDGVVSILAEEQFASRINKIIKNSDIMKVRKDSTEKDERADKNEQNIKISNVPISIGNEKNTVTDTKLTDEKDTLPESIRTRKIEGLGMKDAKSVDERLEENECRISRQRQYQFPTEPPAKEAETEK